jgi:hypothetical protein
MESTSKREESISAKLAKSLFHRNTSVPSLANEKFLAAAQSGNCDVIHTLLASSAVDVNCVDYSSIVKHRYDATPLYRLNKSD